LFQKAVRRANDSLDHSLVRLTVNDKNRILVGERFHDLSQASASGVEGQIRQTQQEVKERLHRWAEKHYTAVISAD
jgi:hypothetical protein